MMESMIEAACQQGLDAQTAKTLVLQTALGSARMAMDSVDDPATLRQNVTSPGGTTQAAIESFQAAGFADIVEAAVEAARRRSVELSAES
jgi:pyrroline-5-carboxylate reductase